MLNLLTRMVRPTRGRLLRTLAARLEDASDDEALEHSDRVVLELDPCCDEQQPERLLKQLCALLPRGTELAFVRYSRPEAATPQPVLGDEAARRAESEPPAAPTQPVALYLFVRTPSRPVDAISLTAGVGEALHACGWAARRAPPGSVQGLWRAWLPVTSSSTAPGQRALVARALARARHPLRQPGANGAALGQLERLQVLQLRLAAGPLGELDDRPGLDALTVELIQGEATRLPTGCEHVAQALQGARLAIQSERLEDGLACGLPWLLETGAVWRHPVTRHLLVLPVSSAAALLPASPRELPQAQGRSRPSS